MSVAANARVGLARWAATVEAALRDTFEHQDAEIAAGLALFETPGSPQRVAIKRWCDVVQQARQMMLQSLRAEVHTTEHRDFSRDVGGSSR